MSKQTHEFLPQRTWFWCVSWPLMGRQWVKGNLLLIWHCRKQTSIFSLELHLESLDSSSGCCLFVPWLCLRVSDGQEISVCAGQWNTAVEGVTAPAAKAETNWTSSSLERMKNKGGTSLLYKCSQRCRNGSPVHLRPLLIAVLVVCCHFKNLLACVCKKSKLCFF